jgi:hypothetical protein
VLLRLSAALHDNGEVQAIDSTSLAQRSSSYNYAKRIPDTFESVKITALVDCDSGAILDVHLFSENSTAQVPPPSWSLL